MKKIYSVLISTLLTSLLAGILFWGCKKEVDFKDVILITGTETTPLGNFSIDQLPASLAITATATTMASQDIRVSFSADTSLVAAYNLTNGSNFMAPPAGSYTLAGSPARIKAGTSISDAVKLTITSLEQFKDGKNYMIPVTITSVEGNLGVLEPSRTIYLKLNRTITTPVASVTNALTVNGAFPTPLNNLRAFTIEGRVYLDYLHSFITTLAVLQGNNSFVLLRFGELSIKYNQLQLINSDGNASTTTEFALKTWYHIAVVYDGSTFRLYVNGKLDGSFPGSRAYDAQSFRFSNSSDQILEGQLSEWRLWSRALNLAEIQNGVCAVDPASPQLEGYWKMNEGTGQAFTDYSGHGCTLTPDKPSINWVPGVKCPN